MATSWIDLQRVIGLIHGDILSISAITNNADVQRQHEPLGDGVTFPSLSIAGLKEGSFPLRTGEGSVGGAGDAGSDECHATLLLVIQHTIATATTSQYAAEGVVSLLRKHLSGRIVQDSTAALGGSQTGHFVRYCAGSPRPFRFESGNGPGDEEGQTIRVIVVEVDLVVRRLGSTLLSGG